MGAVSHSISIDHGIQTQPNNHKEEIMSISAEIDSEAQFTTSAPATENEQLERQEIELNLSDDDRDVSSLHSHALESKSSSNSGETSLSDTIHKVPVDSAQDVSAAKSVGKLGMPRSRAQPKQRHGIFLPAQVFRTYKNQVLYIPSEYPENVQAFPYDCSFADAMQLVRDTSAVGHKTCNSGDKALPKSDRKHVANGAARKSSAKRAPAACRKGLQRGASEKERKGASDSDTSARGHGATIHAMLARYFKPLDGIQHETCSQNERLQKNTEQIADAIAELPTEIKLPRTPKFKSIMQVKSEQDAATRALKHRRCVVKAAAIEQGSEGHAEGVTKAPTDQSPIADHTTATFQAKTPACTITDPGYALLVANAQLRSFRHVYEPPATQPSNSDAAEEGETDEQHPAPYGCGEDYTGLPCILEEAEKTLDL